jgi:F-type H+-transporting ATPase subunit b
MLHDAEFWVGVAFVIFLAIVWKVGGFKSLVAGLDDRGRQVRAELDEAKRLREEAQGVLADYKRRQSDAEREAEALVAGAREEAQRIADEAHQRLNDFVTRRTGAAEARITQAEAQAQQQVRAAAADAAVRISEIVLRDEMKTGLGQDLIGRSLSDVRSKLHS